MVRPRASAARQRRVQGRGGGATNRIQHTITAVAIEHGLHVSLFAELPEDLRKLIKDPKDRPEALPEVDCSPALAAAVRDALAQIASACGTAERNVRREADRLVAEAEARMAAEMAAMSRRLQESAADADAEARTHGAVVAQLEHRLGTMRTELVSAQADMAGRHRELELVKSELHHARTTELKTHARWEQELEHQQAESAAHAASLAAVTERALRAEAERDVVRGLGDRLTGELDALRRTADEAAAHSESEITGLRAELAAARQAHHDADRLRAVAEARLADAQVADARLAEVRVDRAPLAAR